MAWMNVVREWDTLVILVCTSFLIYFELKFFILIETRKMNSNSFPSCSVSHSLFHLKNFINFPSLFHSFCYYCHHDIFWCWQISNFCYFIFASRIIINCTISIIKEQLNNYREEKEMFIQQLKYDLRALSMKEEENDEENFLLCCFFRRGKRWKMKIFRIW